MTGAYSKLWWPLAFLDNTFTVFICITSCNFVERHSISLSSSQRLLSAHSPSTNVCGYYYLLFQNSQFIQNYQLLQVIVMGAEQNGLPKDYQEKLRAIKTNMYEGPLPMMAELERARRKAKERANLGSDAW